MQSMLQRYKSAEREIYRKSSAVIAQAGLRSLNLFSRMLRAGRQSVSILVISHGEEPPRGIRVSFFGLGGAAMLAAACVVLAFAFSAASAASVRKPTSRAPNLYGPRTSSRP